MDPEACLNAAEYALSMGDLAEADERLSDYRGWRSRGGFEPTNGDTREKALTEALVQKASARN